MAAYKSKGSVHIHTYIWDDNENKPHMRSDTLRFENEEIELLVFFRA